MKTARAAINFMTEAIDEVVGVSVPSYPRKFIPSFLAEQFPANI